RKPYEQHIVDIEVKGGELLGFGNACAYNKDGYKTNRTFSYYGQLMAAVRAGEEGSITITCSDETRKESINIPIATN
ncbi:MAG: hypothetical protein K6A23_15325, partial [Butyrivibrio sp.]|nr:hypothetical protein [Butyrivibrio sp.]